MQRWQLSSLILILALIATGPAAGQTIYITDGGNTTLQAINLTSGAITYSVTTHSIGYPIAVRNTIWIGQRTNMGQSREYDRATGGFTGNTANLNNNDQDLLLDGTTDGTFNYSIQFSQSWVYRANLDWSNSQLLFLTSGLGGPALGITYDSGSNHLWLNAGNQLHRMTMTGTEDFSFAHTASDGGIAYNNQDNTLWIVPNTPTAPLFHYSTTGTLLGTLTTPTRSASIWGAEIPFVTAAVPEPGTMVLVSVAGVGLAAAWRRRRLPQQQMPDSEE